MGEFTQTSIVPFKIVRFAAAGSFYIDKIKILLISLFTGQPELFLSRYLFEKTQLTAR
jgi:hypothetical protein